MNKKEFVEAHGNYTARCEVPSEHGEHSWVMNTIPNRVWWCDGAKSSVVPLSLSEFNAQETDVYYEMCNRADEHEPHNWKSLQVQPAWCGSTKHKNCAMCGTGTTDSDCEHAMDQSIRPLPCGNEEPHSSHIWVEQMPFGTKPMWSCPGTVKLEPHEDIPRAEYSTEVARWADTAMFKAEPIDAHEGPRVYLLWMTPDPLGAIAAACKIYKGEVVRDLATVTDEERLDYLAQIQKTKLKAPFEFVKFHFMIEGVTRAFTHQMVRQRTAVYAQESLRFAVKEDMPVGLPPSLAGLSEDDSAVKLWHQAIDDMGESYNHLVEMGMPAEDARGLLPTNILTRLHYSTDLRALLDHAGNRLCTQAQFEWRLVFARIVEAIREMATARLNMADGTSSIYMADELAGLFKPVCYQTGKCEFKANFDRACSIRERVDAFENAGIPSNGWHSDGWVDRERNPLDGIKPGEWLLDPSAARRKA